MAGIGIKEIEEKIFSEFGIPKEMFGYMEENKSAAEAQYEEFLKHMEGTSNDNV